MSWASNVPYVTQLSQASQVNCRDHDDCGTLIQAQSSVDMSTAPRSYSDCRCSVTRSLPAILWSSASKIAEIADTALLWSALLLRLIRGTP